MDAIVSIEDRISAQYGELSTKLRTAADYVAAHPVEVATRSLRSVAQSSGVSPATFSRLLILIAGMTSAITVVGLVDIIIKGSAEVEEQGVVFIRKTDVF